MAPACRIALVVCAAALTGARPLAAEPVPEVAQYVGPGRCEASNCHGSAVPRSDPDAAILQNEYLTWSVNDPHSKAYGVLAGESGFRMARLLGLSGNGTNASTWLTASGAKPEQCLDCHTLNVPAMGRAKSFTLTDGVSCEACHGAAGAWVDRHSDPAWTADQSVELGMVDTRDPAVAAEQCLGCHLGDERRRVGHDLIAAGHPPLVFELYAYAAMMPPHWRRHEGNAGWFDGRAWVAGQAVGLRQAVRHIAEQGRAAGWPEFANYDCFGCHHDLTSESWRKARQRAGGLGRPSLTLSNYATLRVVGRALAPREAPSLDAAYRRLADLVRAGETGEALAEATPAVATAADRILDQISPTSLGVTEIDQLLRALAGEGRSDAPDGFRTAQQVAWGLEALAVARVNLTNGSLSADPLRATLDPLFDELRSPKAYSPEGFARQLQRVTEELP